MATIAKRTTNRAAELRLALLAAALFALVGCASDETPAAGGPPGGPPRGGPPSAEDAPPPGVRVASALGGQLNVEQPFTGDVVALDSVQLSPDVAGRLDELLVDEGDLVTAGQVIARLDDTVARYDASLERQRVETSRARVARAAAEITANRAEQSRLRPLVDAGARTNSELVSLAERAEVLATDLEVAQAELDAQRGAASAASVRRDRAEIVAPFDGVVVMRHVSVGAQVDARTPVVDIVDRTSLRVRVEVPESQLPLLTPGTGATVRFDGVGAEVFVASVERSAPRVRQESRTATLDLRLAEPPPTLAEGMLARGAFITGSAEGGVLVPLGAVSRSEEGAKVWVVTDGTASPVDVEVMIESADQAMVSGVTEGAQVIVSPTRGFEAGVDVIVVGQ